VSPSSIPGHSPPGRPLQAQRAKALYAAGHFAYMVDTRWILVSATDEWMKPLPDVGTDKARRDAPLRPVTGI